MDEESTTEDQGKKQQSQSPPASEGPTVTEVTPEGISSQAIPTETPTDISPPPAEPPMFVENRRKYIFIGLGVLFFLIILVVVIRLLTRGKGEPKKVTLTYWGLWEEQQVFDPLIEEYEKKNPQVEIKYVKMEPKDYREKVIERSKNKQGPDIFRYHSTWLSTLNEVVAPLPQTVMSNEEFEKTFYPVATDDLKIGDHYYGLPLEIDGLVLVYNDDMFKRVGIETAPTTWEDILDYAAKLTVKDRNGQIITSGIALGTASNVEHFSDILGFMLLQNSGNVEELDRKQLFSLLRNLTSDEAVGALKAYRKFAEPPDNVWDESMPNSVIAFIQGKVAMIIVPSWEILLVKLTNPDINLKVTTLPVVPGGNQVSLSNYWVEGVSKLNPHQNEAWQFLRFLVEKDNLTKLYQEQTKTRLFGEPYSRVDLASVMVQNEYIGPVVQQAKFMKSLPLTTRTYDNGINDQIVKYLEDAINNTIKGVSYREALLTAEKGVVQVFEKYGIE